MPEPSLSQQFHESELIVENEGPPTIGAVLADAPDFAPEDRPKKTFDLALWLAVGWIALVTLLAVFAGVLPFIKPYDQINPAFKQPPSGEYWFGTDKIGRDVFSRTVYGARLSLTIGFVAITLGLFFGALLGLASGYFRGWFDRVTSIVMDIMLSFPALVLALALVSFLDPSATTVILALSILSIPPLTRIVRATTMAFSTREFVTAARSLGFALTGLAVLIIAEGALSFLGVGVPPPRPSWGGIIAEGQQELRDAWWISLLPAAVLFLTVLAFNVLGDVFSKRFDIRESSL
jgi:peptide/nickel transport system permease protein